MKLEKDKKTLHKLNDRSLDLLKSSASTLVSADMRIVFWMSGSRFATSLHRVRMAPLALILSFKSSSPPYSCSMYSSIWSKDTSPPRLSSSSSSSAWNCRRFKSCTSCPDTRVSTYRGGHVHVWMGGGGRCE